MMIQALHHLKLIISYKSYNKPLGWVEYGLVLDEKTEVQRGLVTCLRTHSKQVREPRVLKEMWLGVPGLQTKYGYMVQTVFTQLLG